MLIDQFFMLDTTEGLRAASLPEALAALCAGKALGFDGLAAHQRHAFDLFLWQIAAMALVRSGEARAADDADAWRGLADPHAWRQRLEALTPGCADTAWSLVVGDLRAPAFLQPPIGHGALAGYSVIGATPDEIDVLVTSKDHDVKMARAFRAEPRHWIFALLTLQTLQGYSGRGNFGIARMNGGFSSRPLLALHPDRTLAGRFRRGVRTALRARTKALTEDSDYFGDDGLPLLWLRGWDTDEGLSPTGLDPLFVEICRRVRLVRAPDGRIVAWGRPSEAARVAMPKEGGGNTGDAWTPIAAKDGAALTVGTAGFDYRLLHRVLFSPEFHRPMALQPLPDDPDTVWLQATVLVRGQGKTEGLSERWQPLSRRFAQRMCDPDEAPDLGKIAATMVEQARAGTAALRMALLAYLQGGPDKIDQKDERPRGWLDRLEADIDAMFFEHLVEIAQAGGAAELDWQRALRDLVLTQFDDALARLSPPECRRERARAVASRVLGGVLVKGGLVQPRLTENA